MNPLLNPMFYFKLLPYLVAGIQAMHADAPGSTKKHLAMEALGLAEGSVEIAAPELKPVIDETSKAVSTIIDNSVSVFNATKKFGFGKSSTAAASSTSSAPTTLSTDAPKATV